MEECLDLSKKLIDSLQKLNYSIVIVESCTGGGLTNIITDIPGASQVFEAGFITYSEDAKMRMGVSSVVIQKHTVYSRETAIEMAKAGLLQSRKAQVAVAITGLLTTPDLRHPQVQPGHAYLAVLSPNRVHTQEVVIHGTNPRWKDKETIIIFALQQILTVLKHSDDDTQ